MGWVFPIDPAKALIFDGQDQKVYALQFVTRPEGKDDPRLQKFVRTTGFANDRLAFALGLDHWIDPEDRPFHPQTVRSELYGLLAQAEQDGTQALLPTPLQGNVQRLAALVGLSAVDAQILAFAVCLHTDQLLDDAADLLDAVSSTQVIQTLALLVQAPDAQVRQALGSQGLLARSGLVVLDQRGIGSLKNKLDLLSHSFADQMVAGDRKSVV